MDDERCTLCNARMKREYSPNGVSALVCSDRRCLIHDLDALDADWKRKKQSRPAPDLGSSPFGRGILDDDLGRGRHILRPTFPAESGFGRDQSFRSPRDRPVRAASPPRGTMGFDDPFKKDRRGGRPSPATARREPTMEERLKDFVAKHPPPAAQHQQTFDEYLNSKYGPPPAAAKREPGLDDFFRKKEDRPRDRGRSRGRGNDPFKDMDDFMAREMADMENMMRGLGGLGGRFKGPTKNPFGGQSAPEGASAFPPNARPAPGRRDPSPPRARGVPGGRSGGGLFGHSPREGANMKPRGPARVELEIEEHDGRSVRGEKPAPFAHVQTEGPDGEVLDGPARGPNGPSRARDPTNDPFARLRRDAGRSKWR